MGGGGGERTKPYLSTSEAESSHHSAAVGYLARNVGTAQKEKKGNYRPVLFTFYALYNIIVVGTFGRVRLYATLRFSVIRLLHSSI